MNTFKNAFVASSAIAIILLFTAFKMNDNSFDEKLSKDYVSTVCNDVLFERFELQFSLMLKEVTQVDVHYNESNGYYYVVQGSSPDGSPITEYFKTSKREVEAGIYDYIGLNKNSMDLTARRACREDFDNIPNWCNKYNSGPICGYSTPYGCIYY